MRRPFGGSPRLGALAAVLLASACASGPQRLEYAQHRSEANRGLYLDYAVYTPPGFTPDESLPLVVFLHGGGDSETAFDRAGLGQRLDREIRQGTIPRVVVLVPDGSLGFWADWHDGSHRYESWVVDELMPRVAERCGTRPCPEGCHLMGVSMGGSGTLRWTLHNPGLFASATILSAPIFDTDQMLEFADDRLWNILLPMHRLFGPTDERDLPRIRRSDPFVQWHSPEDLGGTELFLAWAEGDRDGIARTGRALHRHLEERGIPHEQRIFAGGHDWRSWSPVILDAIRMLVGEPPGDGAPLDALATGPGH